MNVLNYFARPDAFDPRGTPYAGDSAARDPGLAGLFGGVAPSVDPARYPVMNALAGRGGGADEAWASTDGSPWQRGPVQEFTRNVLASEPVTTALNVANFLGPAMGRIPRPVMAPEGGGGIRAYHGSPHDFERFDASRIGTGHGSQVEGYGLNFSANESTAADYRRMLADRAANGKGHMYEVRINASPEQFIDLEKPFGAHPPEVQAAVKRAVGPQTDPDYPRLFDPSEPMGTAYGAISAYHGGGQKVTSERLGREGVVGKQHPDWDGPDGTKNYAVFPGHEKLIEILRKYGVAGLLTASAAAGSGNQAEAAR